MVTADVPFDAFSIAAATVDFVTVAAAVAVDTVNVAAVVDAVTLSADIIFEIF